MKATRIVRFKPRKAPAPGTQFMRLTAAEAAFLSDMRRLDRFAPDVGYCFAETVRCVLATYKKNRRSTRKNIGKPVIDLTGDDREGA